MEDGSDHSSSGSFSWMNRAVSTASLRNIRQVEAVEVLGGGCVGLDTDSRMSHVEFILHLVWPRRWWWWSVGGIPTTLAPQMMIQVSEGVCGEHVWALGLGPNLGQWSSSRHRLNTGDTSCNWWPSQGKRSVIVWDKGGFLVQGSLVLKVVMEHGNPTFRPNTQRWRNRKTLERVLVHDKSINYWFLKIGVINSPLPTAFSYPVCGTVYCFLVTIILFVSKVWPNDRSTASVA